jgi:hypothetical protein
VTVERKVKAAVAGAGTTLAVVVGILASVPAATWQQLPPWAQLAVAVAAAVTGAGGAGMAAPHTWRTDPDALSQAPAAVADAVTHAGLMADIRRARGMDTGLTELGLILVCGLVAAAAAIIVVFALGH